MSNLAATLETFEETLREGDAPSHKRLKPTAPPQLTKTKPE